MRLELEPRGTTACAGNLATIRSVFFTPPQLETMPREIATLFQKDRSFPDIRHKCELLLLLAIRLNDASNFFSKSPPSCRCDWKNKEAEKICQEGPTSLAALAKSDPLTSGERHYCVSGLSVCLSLSLFLLSFGIPAMPLFQYSRLPGPLHQRFSPKHLRLFTPLYKYVYINLLGRHSHSHRRRGEREKPTLPVDEAYKRHTFSPRKIRKLWQRIRAQ